MTPSRLSVDELETVYDALAQAIDEAAASGQSELLLTKLALLQANALGNAALFQAHLRVALQDLDSAR